MGRALPTLTSTPTELKFSVYSLDLREKLAIVELKEVRFSSIEVFLLSIIPRWMRRLSTLLPLDTS